MDGVLGFLFVITIGVCVWRCIVSCNQAHADEWLMFIFTGVVGFLIPTLLGLVAVVYVGGIAAVIVLGGYVYVTVVSFDERIVEWTRRKLRTIGYDQILRQREPGVVAYTDIDGYVRLFEERLPAGLAERGIRDPLPALLERLPVFARAIFSDPSAKFTREMEITRFYNITEQRYQDLMLGDMFDVIAVFMSLIPPQLSHQTNGSFQMDLCDFLVSSPNPVGKILAVLAKVGARPGLQHTLPIIPVDQNHVRIALTKFSPQAVAAGKRLEPSDYPGSVLEAAHAYFHGTPYLGLFTVKIPWGIPDDVRFEHQWVVAPSGTGKTTLLQTQIVSDLERVAAGECSIIVIDSQNQLIPKIAHLKLFAAGQPLHGKLVVIEPDPDYPPALNVLDIGLSELSARDRYRMQAEALENVKSCMATMADTQDDMLSYLVELCFAIPDATIQTIVDILKPNGLDDYRPFLADVDQTCRDYFETAFSPRSQGTNVTKEALLRRLMGMLRNPTFRRMFLNKRGKFSMAKELETSKVILINTDLEFLRHDACQLFGRFFIAQLLQAAEMRGEGSLPVFCYVDECQDYIANDDNAAKLMDKARKRKVGMIFAHQRLRNIESPNVTDALSNVGVRFAGGNETDAQYLSRIFRTEPEFIAHKQRGTFACFVRRATPHAIEVNIPPDALERMERMTADEYTAIRADMRGRYCQPASQEHRPAPIEPEAIPTPAPQPAAGKPRRKRPVDPDIGTRTQAAGDWEP